MKIHKPNKRYLGTLIAATSLLSACGGGSNSNGGQNATGPTIQAATPVVRALFSTQQCLSASLNATGSGWYIGNATIGITNNCDSAIDLAGSTLSFTSIDNSGGFASWGDAGTYTNDANYKISFTQGSGNTEIGTITADKAWTGKNDNGTILPHTSIVFGGTGVNTTNGGSYQLNVANSTLTINGSAPVAQTGSMTVSVNTKNAGCSGTICNAIKVTVNDINGKTVATVAVPVSSAGAIYTQKIESLNVGSYTLSASAVSNDTITYTPSATPAVVANTDTPVTVNYQQAQQVGQAAITLPNVFSGYTGNLLVKLLNTKESNSVVNTYSMTQGQTLTTEALPISDTKHQYAIQVQGIADPAAGNFYVESGLPIVSITNNKITAINIPFKTASVTKRTVSFALSGLNNSTAGINFQDSAQKYAYPGYTGLANATVKYYFESSTTLGYSVAAVSGNYKVNPIESTNLITANKTISVAFESAPAPSGATVAGWPNYLAMGTVTDANTTNNGGLSGRPVDSIFKYGGDGGNGDPGKIVFPIYTMNTIAVAGSLTKEYGKHVMPTMVDYTAEMSGGTAYKDFGYDQPSAGAPLVYQGESIPAMHFVNLMLDAQTLQQSKSTDNAYPGSIIINPDLLGMVQQQKLFANGGTLSTLNIPVNKSLQEAVCFMKRKFGPTDFTLSNGETVTVAGGTPMEMAVQLRNSGKVWSYWDIKSVWEDKAVNVWYPSCVSNSDVGATIPTFVNSFKGWIQATNWAIKYFGPDVTFGWQENVWAVDSANWIHQLNTSQAIQSNISDPIVSLWKDMEVYNGKYKPDFLVFDRYEMDDSAAYGVGYWYNARDWNNYLTFVQQISSGLGNQPVMLWQIPGGHIQTQAEVVANPSYQRASTAPGYFFGQSELSADLSNMADYLKQISLNSSYYNCTGTGCQMTNYMTMNNYNWSKDNGNLKLAANANVFAILWGGGQTQSVGTFPINDNGWLANKIKTYYQNPQKLK